MTRKCHNHTPQISPRRREEEAESKTATWHQGDNKSKKQPSYSQRYDFESS